jgi:HEAT repeat protein
MLRALRFAAPGLLLVCQCGGSASLRAAEAGRFTGLSAVVAAEVKRGEIDDGEAVDLARAILRRDVAGAAGDEGASRIRGLAGCARPLDRALEHRAEDEGPAPAAAAMLRLEAGLSPREDFVHWASEAPGGPRAAFRAVGARALWGSDDGQLRRKLFLDGDQAVRLAALRAAERAASASDTDAVLDAARVDPFPMARTQAVRAAGAIGGERVVLALKDLWAAADPTLRQAIADAWGTPASVDAGGRRELSWAADTQGGAPAIAAAYALVRAGNHTTPMPTGPGVAEALGVIERAIKSGVTHERTFAITIAPTSAPALQNAMIEASKDVDEDVALAATIRRLDTPAGWQGGAFPTDRPALIARLLAAASSTDKMRGLVARNALARIGVRDVLPLLDKEASSTDAQARKAAGTAFVALGELPRAAVLAVDADARVRDGVACSLLTHAAR